MQSNDDIVAVGGDLDPETLIRAYSLGIFPWPMQEAPAAPPKDLALLWFCPRERAVLELEKLHLSRSLERARRKCSLRFTIDAAFSDVIRACAGSERPGQRGTWITPEMIVAYVGLHHLGIAHSVEAWSGGELVGGIYGVDAGGAFSAESMFYRQPNASKLALLRLIEHLRARGLEWLDIQVMTPHMERLGALTITREAFLDRLAATQALRLELFP